MIVLHPMQLTLGNMLSYYKTVAGEYNFFNLTTAPMPGVIRPHVDILKVNLKVIKS